MQVVGRNEPCPCGSGKKYKKCCASKKVVNLQTLLVNEQMDLQLAFLNEGKAPNPQNNKDSYQYILEETQDVFGEPQFLTVYLTYLFGLRETPSHWDAFLDERIPQMERPRMKELASEWREPVSVLADVGEMDEATREVQMTDLLDGTVYDVIIPEFHSWASIDFLFTYLLPLEDKWVPYGFMFPSVYTKDEKSTLVNRLQVLNRDELLTDEGIVSVITALVGRDEADGEDWFAGMLADHEENEDQQSALHEMKAYWDGQGDDSLPLFACHLAADYFAEHGEKIRKPQTYLAAISYLMSQHATDTPLTQKEAGEAFDVTASSVSSAVRKIEDWFKEELSEFKK
ncbi:YecA family protein [Jeotgalibacillus sp. R-1-5s-1]|uniref:YecA family protein n=1 Tax=Jeotgalibacillus sp. R-1-5s-1 TaxID=2555897 RepID=UPI00106BAD25|nr:SEC-C domain-containing protein [Jeotgalibacillus sp. R-1-5s-1]TFD95810.1 hypothetical protein E2491_11555 [Jeotgalibacillus sp. R-1-5s-1]